MVVSNDNYEEGWKLYADYPLKYAVIHTAPWDYSRTNMQWLAYATNAEQLWHYYVLTYDNKLSTLHNAIRYHWKPGNVMLYYPVAPEDVWDDLETVYYD